jgi:hypothetical protein
MEIVDGDFYEGSLLKKGMLSAFTSLFVMFTSRTHPQKLEMAMVSIAKWQFSLLCEQHGDSAAWHVATYELHSASLSVATAPLRLPSGAFEAWTFLVPHLCDERRFLSQLGQQAAKVHHSELDDHRTVCATALERFQLRQGAQQGEQPAATAARRIASAPTLHRDWC